MSPERFVHYVTGHNEIDQEHVILFVKLSELAKALQDGNVEKASDLVVEVKSLMLSHGLTETHAMKKYNYPYITYHIQQHVQLGTELNDLQTKLGEMKFFSHVFISDFEEKFIDHLDHADRNFVDWVKAQGLM